MLKSSQMKNLQARSKFILFFSQENLELAKAELSALYPKLEIAEDNGENIIVFGEINNPGRLPLTRKILDFNTNKMVFENPESWENRASGQPISLSPKLARAMINLTGTENGVITDPFCGSGGILLEAGLLGHKVIGYDIDNIILKTAKDRLDSFKIKAKLECKDASSIDSQIDYCVTDLPYGKNTSLESLITTYTNFLKNLNVILKYKAVIGFPHFVSGEVLANLTGFLVLGKYHWKLHRSLTKEILVLVPKKSPISALKSKE